VAARLKPFPGIGNVGLLESNGHQNYAHWDLMQQRTPFYGAKWTEVRDGFYTTDADFFARSGGIFEEVKHYEEMFRGK
jgi:hypothetical protein